MTTTTESTAATIADNPIKEPVSEDKAGLEEIEEGELPEEGEITDDDEDEVESAAKNQQAENKPQRGAPTTQQSQKQRHNERRSKYQSNKGRGRDRGVTWRKSFFGHHQQQLGRNNKFTPNRSAFYRPPRFYHQQGQGQPGIQQQHRFQHQQQHQSPHPDGGMPINFPPPPPPNSGEHHQQLLLQPPPPPDFGQSAQQFMPEGGQHPPPQSTSFSREFREQQQHGIGTILPPPIPLLGLVLPPMLPGTSNFTTQDHHQNPFAYFFNPAGNVQQQPSHPQQHMHPPPTSVGISIPPQPSFQQLQQQVQQHGITPHFPHQPSLLGPTANVPPGISQMPPNIQQQMRMELPFKQQQEFSSGQSAAHIHESSLAFQQPTSSMDEQKKDVKKSPSDGGGGGGFNINQMLEEITREQSSSSSSPGTKKIVKFADPTMDLIFSIGYGPGGMGLSGLLADDESSASPAVGTDEQMHGDKPAAVIPVTCEWKLHIVDIPPPTDPNLHFDMKFIQQMSSSNSDPRLRRLVEKQFDLVSKMVEKQQQEMANTSQQQKEGDGESSIVSELQSSMTGRGNNYHRGGRPNGGTGSGGRHQAHHQQPADSPKQHQQSSPQQQQNTGSQSPQQKLPPAAPPKMSLWKKRKNNEYDKSPLARLASSVHIDNKRKCGI